MPAIIRVAIRSDIPGMHRVRLAVYENRLTSSRIEESDYVTAMEDTGRGWVALDGDSLLGFAIGNRITGNIWALFVDPEHEGRGLGRRLHTAMIAWLFSQGLRRLWLSTESGTRAERFYEAAGWRYSGRTADGEVHYEMFREANGAEPDATDNPGDAQ